MLDINNQRKGGQMLVLQKIFFPRSKVLRGDVECVFQRYWYIDIIDNHISDMDM